jgi:hypothetical protein
VSYTPSRRSVLKAGAWTAPAIVLVGAAPAFAMSGGRNITVSAGATEVRTDESGLSELYYDGFTITPDSAVGAGGLRMIVTNPDGDVFGYFTPSGWSRTQSNASTVTFTRTLSVAAGATVTIPSNTYFADEGTGGSFVVTLTATNHDPTQVSFPIV